MSWEGQIYAWTIDRAIANTFDSRPAAAPRVRADTTPTYLPASKNFRSVHAKYVEAYTDAQSLILTPSPMPIALSRSCWSPQQLPRRLSSDKRAMTSVQTSLRLYAPVMELFTERVCMSWRKWLPGWLRSGTATIVGQCPLFGSDYPLQIFGPLYIACGLPERSLPDCIWTIGPLCPFFHKFVLFWALNFVCLDASAHPFLCINFVFSFYSFMPFHVVEVLIVFCCTFVVIYS